MKNLFFSKVRISLFIFIFILNSSLSVGRVMSEKSDGSKKIKKVSVSDLQQSFFDMIVLLILGVEEVLEKEINSKREDNSILLEVLNIFKWTTFHVKILRDDMNFYSREVLEINIEKAEKNLLYLENIKNNNLKKNKEGK